MIRVAIGGIGNCASSLIQGIEYYKKFDTNKVIGLMHPTIGKWGIGDIQIVAAFDVDYRKVGKPVEEAIFAKPNCTMIFQKNLPVSNVKVQMGPILDGIADHMADYPEDLAFRPAKTEPVDIVKTLKDTKAEIFVCFLPVGAEKAVYHYAQACIDAGVAMINCIPVFIASNPEWADKFKSAGLPIVGDDVKSQLGATIIHRVLTRLFEDRGINLHRTYQLNTGGNTDFLNMLAFERTKSKKKSKTESVQSQLEEPIDACNIHIGPSDYVQWQEDNKLAFIRMEGYGFGNIPIKLDLKLSVQDSPNSAGVVIDAIRCVKIALDRKFSGPLEAVSAYYMKSPPRQMRDSDAKELCDAYINEITYNIKN